jgi:hypothetical protein
MPSAMPRTAAEEAFLEQTPWANPQHPIHQQSSQQRQQSRVSEQARMPSYTTPAGQKRVVDIHAPNGSASTIADHQSAANSSAANTPYGTEQESRQQGHFSNPDYDALDRKSGFRSLSSSPLDVRKPHPHANAPESGPRNVGYSPPSARLGLFNTPSKGESSPPLTSRNINAIHQSTGLTASAGSSRMTARWSWITLVYVGCIGSFAAGFVFFSQYVRLKRSNYVDLFSLLELVFALFLLLQVLLVCACGRSLWMFLFGIWGVQYSLN